jgi:hypothetical protein
MIHIDLQPLPKPQPQPVTAWILTPAGAPQLSCQQPPLIFVFP